MEQGKLGEEVVPHPRPSKPQGSRGNASHPHPRPPPYTHPQAGTSTCGAQLSFT